MWEPSQATSDKDINGLVLLASAGCRLFGERIHRETCTSLWWKEYRPSAPYMGAQRYQAEIDFVALSGHVETSTNPLEAPAHPEYGLLRKFLKFGRRCCTSRLRNIKLCKLPRITFSPLRQCKKLKQVERQTDIRGSR
jgi:hypothetical protein